MLDLAVSDIPARVDVHQHVIPDFYRDALTKAGIGEAGGVPARAVCLLDRGGVARREILAC